MQSSNRKEDGSTMEAQVTHLSFYGRYISSCQPTQFVSFKMCMIVFFLGIHVHMTMHTCWCAAIYPAGSATMAMLWVAVRWSRDKAGCESQKFKQVSAVRECVLWTHSTWVIFAPCISFHDDGIYVGMYYFECGLLQQCSHSCVGLAQACPNQCTCRIRPSTITGLD